MPDRFEDLLALALQLLVLAAPVAAARAWARRSWPAGAARAAAIGLIAAGASAATMLALGFGALLRPIPIVLALAAVSLALAHAPGPAVLPAARAERPATNRWLGVAAVVVGAPVAFGALLRAPSRWDDLTYHLFYPASWLQRGALFVPDLPAPHVKAATFPADGELLHALAMSVLRSDLLVPVLGVVWVALFGVATWALARACGLSERGAAASGLLAATLPTVLSRSATAYVDGLLDFALVVSLLFVVRLAAAPIGRMRWEAAIAGVAAGLAAGVKFVGAPVALAVGLAVLVTARVRGRRWRPAFGALGWFCVPVLVLAAPWYLRNFALTGNPVWPAPLLDLPALEHALYPWRGTSVGARLGELAGSGVLTEALFALPRGASPMTLGWLVAVLAPLTLLGVGRASARAVRAARRGQTLESARGAVPVLGLGLFVGSFLALPTWNNDGLFRSEVRFAAPAAAVAVLLALGEVERWRRGPGILLALGLGGPALHVAQAGILPPLAALPPVAAIPALTIAGAAALGAIGRRARGAASRALGFAAGAALLLVGLLLGWAVREATRTSTVVDPRADGSPAAPAELARFVADSEAVLGAHRRLAFAATVNYEFPYLLVGPRLDRRVEWVPPCPESLRLWPRSAGAPCREVSREAWARGVEGRDLELLVVSRWGLGGGRWPLEDAWARQAGWPLLARSTSYRIYRVPAGRGGPQPDSQARER